MPVSPRIIKGRIKSIKSTRKITKAMELVSAAKMKKAVDKAMSSRPFSAYAYQVLERIVGSGQMNHLHPLLAERPIKTTLLILVTANRGLVGGLTTNLLNFVASSVQDPMFRPEGSQIEAVTVGKKGQGMLARLGIPLVASFETLTDNPTLDDVRPIASLIMNGFLSKKYDRVFVANSDFISAVNQKPHMRQILPVSRTAIATVAGGTSTSDDYTFEPSARAVLDEVIPKIVLTQTYQAIVEARASEQSARMVAMKNASDNAKEIIDDLQSLYNRVRQAKITQEIAEISAGKAALE